MDRKKKNVILKIARSLAFSEEDIKNLSYDLFDKEYESLTDDDANEMIYYLRSQDADDYWGVGN